MPEYPDIMIYIESLQRLVQGQTLRSVRIAHPFVLRTVEPPITALHGHVLHDLERIGKRIVFAFEDDLLEDDLLEDDLFLVLHLMISGRL